MSNPISDLISFAAEIARDIAKAFRLPQVRRLAFATAILAVCFGLPLSGLVRFAAGSDLYSHIILIPVISVVLVWFRREKFAGESPPNRRLAVFFFLLGGIALAGWAAVAWSPAGASLAIEDRLAVSTLPPLLIFVGLAAWFLGRGTLRIIAFPLAFLVFMLPFPVAAEIGLETFFQHTSAEAAYLLFSAAGTPVFRAGLIFELPGITLEVARECSGIHSSLVLFIVSLAAGEVMLRSRWRRAVLVLFVIPLGIARNGFRVFVLGQLCVYDDVGWIHSPLHHRGGPIFFALSLIPLFLVLYLLWRTDRPRASAIGAAPAADGRAGADRAGLPIASSEDSGR